MNKPKWLAAGIATALVVGGLAITALAQTPTSSTGAAVTAPANPPAQNTPAQGKQARWEAGIRQRALAEAILKASGKTREELKTLKQGKTWQEVATALGLDWTQIQKEAQTLAQNQIRGRHEEGAIVGWLAKQTGKTPAEIQALKIKDKTWEAVLKELNIDPKELAQARAQWVKGQDRQAGVVAFLAQLTGKSPKDILALKTPTNTWVDVAKQLGVTVNK